MSISIENYENKVIRIKSKYNGSYLMVKDFNVRNHTNVVVGRLSEYDDSQKWIVKRKSNSYVIASCKNPNYELDYHIGTYGTYGNYGNCTVFQHIKDSDFNDAKIEFSGTERECRIKNTGRGTFLHTLYSESNSNVEWKNYEYRDKQIWKIEIVKENIRPNHYSLNLKYRSINQKFYGKYANLIRRNEFCDFNPYEDKDPMYLAGCSRCSVACVLSNIANIEINPYDIPVKKNAATWKAGNFRVDFKNIPNKKVINKNIIYKKISDGSNEQNLKGIRDCIDLGYPAICRISNGQNSYHFFVAYGYINNAINESDILTYDTVFPKNYNNPDQQNTNLYGEDKHLKRAMDLENYYHLTEVFTYVEI